MRVKVTRWVKEKNRRPSTNRHCSCNINSCRIPAFRNIQIPELWCSQITAESAKEACVFFKNIPEGNVVKDLNRSYQDIHKHLAHLNPRFYIHAQLGMLHTRLWTNRSRTLTSFLDSRDKTKSLESKQVSWEQIQSQPESMQVWEPSEIRKDKWGQQDFKEVV